MATIICIDDNPADGKKNSDVLTQAGFNVLLATDADEGLELILKHKPDLVLQNTLSPNNNRYKILKEVRENYPLMAEMLFIFLSDVTDSNQILSDLQAGADTFLIKPIDPNLMLATIQASLRQVKRIKFRHEQLLVLDI